MGRQRKMENERLGRMIGRSDDMIDEDGGGPEMG